jgi:dTDP-4-dehydrorhamnose 3,5-epimerase
MQFEETPLKGCYVIRTTPFIDHRGAFARFFCSNELKELIGNRHIVNINFSHTVKKGSIRGMHFQYPPMAEMKFIRCINGSVYDIVVDIRKNSPSFLKWYGLELTADNMNMLCVPEGFAHGFQVLEDSSELLYLHTEFYSKEHEGALNYADPALSINWPLEHRIISERDINHKFIDEMFDGVVL